MTILKGADSATPKPDKYEGKEVWGSDIMTTVRII